jgi:hypothetical protein
MIRRLASGSAIALLSASSLGGQEIVRIGDAPACDCEIRIEHVVTLADLDGRAGLASPLTLTRLPDGRFLVVTSIDQTSILLFDATGRFVRRAGRRGGGPDEFGGILAIRSGPADSIHVLDAMNARYAVIGPDLQVARTVRLETRGGQFEILDDGSTVMLGPVRRAPPLERLHVLDANGTRVRSFMPQPDAAMPAAHRRFTATRSGTIAVSHGRDYVIEIWDAAGQHRKTVFRDAPWFPPFSPDGPRGPTQKAPQFDPEGRLWTLNEVADPNAPAALAPRLPPNTPGLTRLPPPPMNELYDSVLEVLDLESGTLLATKRVEESILTLLPGGFAASYREDATGNPFIDVWRLTLIR